MLLNPQEPASPAGLSFLLRPRLPWVDPVICGLGLLVSAPFCMAAVSVPAEGAGGVVASFALMFVGQVFLNVNWAVVVDISLV